MHRTQELGLPDILLLIQGRYAEASICPVSASHHPQQLPGAWLLPIHTAGRHALDETVQMIEMTGHPETLPAFDALNHGEIFRLHLMVEIVCAGESRNDSVDLPGDLYDLEECSTIEDNDQESTDLNEPTSFNERLFNTADSTAPFLQPNSSSSAAHTCGID